MASGSSPVAYRSTAAQATASPAWAGVVNRASTGCGRPGRATERPADDTPRTIATVCQCGGSRTATVSPPLSPRPSISRFAVLATQFSRVAPDSSVRSPVASSYQVSSGVVGSGRTADERACGIVVYTRSTIAASPYVTDPERAMRLPKRFETGGVAVTCPMHSRRRLASGLNYTLFGSCLVTAGRPPRVLVDATSVPADRGGVGRYVDGLLGALAQMEPDRVDLAVVAQRSDAERYSRMLVDAEVIAGPAAVAHRPARLAWEQTGLPLLAQQVGAKVLHSPFYTCPLRAGCPVTVTVHDATFFTEPEHYDNTKRTFFRSAIKTSLRRAARVIVPSKATRDELIRLLDADPGRLDVAYHGVDHEAFHQPGDDEKRRVRARLGLGDTPYVAFLGAKEPRKNVPNLIRGWVAAVSGRDNPPALVGAGGSGHDDEIDQAVAEVPAGLRLLRPGYLRYADLPGFLGGALVAAYPSHGEGFGLPVLEAMACGAPVLTTPRLSLPEVGGDAVAYTGPEPGEIARDLRALLDDEPRRMALAEAGLSRAKEFSWDTS